MMEGVNISSDLFTNMVTQSDACFESDEKNLVKEIGQIELSEVYKDTELYSDIWQNKTILDSCICKNNKSNVSLVLTKNGNLVKHDFDTCEYFPRNESMMLFKKRFDTFYNWPKQLVQKPGDMAKAGFYYTGKGDNVRCFFCNIGLHMWEIFDNVLSEHRTKSPNCKFAQMLSYY